MAWAVSDQMNLGEEWIAERGNQYPPKTLHAAHLLSTSEATQALYLRAERLGLDSYGNPANFATLPRWAATWPGGQLAAAARNGRFADNLRRYLKYFRRDQLLIVELDGLKPATLAQTLRGVCAHVGAVLDQNFEGACAASEERRNADSELKRNSGMPVDPKLEPTQAELASLRRYYAPHNEALFGILGYRYDHWGAP